MSSENAQNPPHIQLQKIYVRDLSFESPRGAEALGHVKAPEIKLQLNNQARRLENDHYEVVLDINVKAMEKETDKPLYEVEVKQAGLFVLTNFPEEELDTVLNAYCPGVLFPYARETVSGAIERGGFPQLLLNPINFDAIYRQHREKVKQAEQEAASDGPTH